MKETLRSNLNGYLFFLINWSNSDPFLKNFAEFYLMDGILSMMRRGASFNGNAAFEAFFA
jgi:hypothetical protein